MAQSLSLTSVRRRAAYNAQIESLSAAASQACSLTKKFTRCAPDGTDVVTVADGSWIGQEKWIGCVGGTSTPVVTVTPATTAGGWTTVTLQEGESVLLVWLGSSVGWGISTHPGALPA
jgi:hypothetical protein